MASDPMNRLRFSETQNAVITTGITTVAVAVVMTFIGVLLWALCAFLSRVSLVITPLLVALILTLLFRPYYDWLYEKLFRSKSKTLAVTTLFASILIPIALIVFCFGSLFISQITALIDGIPALITKINTWITTNSPQIQALITRFNLDSEITILSDPQGFVKSIFDSISMADLGNTAFSYSLGAIKSVFALLSWIIVPVYIIYFITAKPVSGHDVEKFLPFLKPDTRKDIGNLVDQFLTILIAFFRGQIIIVMIDGLLYGTGFFLVGLPYGFLIGFMLGMMNIIPYLGCAIGLTVALPLAFFGDGGSLARLILVLAVFATVQCTDGYFITPKIQGKRTGLSDAAVIFSLLFWGVLFGGILGMLLAIPLSAFAVVLWRLLKNKYFKEWL